MAQREESGSDYISRELHRCGQRHLEMGPEARHGTRWLLRVNNCRASKSEPSPSSSLRPPSSTPGHSPNRPHLANPTCSFLLFIHREPSPHRHRHLAIASGISPPVPVAVPSHPPFRHLAVPISHRAASPPVAAHSSTPSPRGLGCAALLAPPSPSPRASSQLADGLAIATSRRPTPTSHHGLSHPQLHRGLLRRRPKLPRPSPRKVVRRRHHRGRRHQDGHGHTRTRRPPPPW